MSVCLEIDKQNSSKAIFNLILEIDYSNNNCIKCHEGIEHFREHKTEMMHSILKYADTSGIKNNDCCRFKKELDELRDYLISGDINEQRNFLHWEYPPIVLNGEH